jgi:hypothetical protein
MPPRYFLLPSVLLSAFAAPADAPQGQGQGQHQDFRIIQRSSDQDEQSKNLSALFRIQPSIEEDEEACSPILEQEALKAQPEAAQK